MRIHPPVRSVLAAVLAVGSVLPGAAWAQSTAARVPAEEEAAPAKDESETTANATGNNIVVTATKRDQTLQNVAVAITVTTAATITLAHIRDIEDLATVVPSLRVVDHQSSAQTAFVIRGFGNGDNVGAEPAVGVFIDGVYRSRSAARIEDFADVAQVEVLRGPQSTLFGKNASAGVINILTPEPKFKAAGNAEISYGNHHAIFAKGVITGPLSKDVAVSIAGGYDRRDGYVHDAITGRDINNRDRWFLRGQWLYEPNTQLKVRLIADYGRITELCCATLLQSLPATPALLAIGDRVNPAAARFADVVYRNFDPTNDIRDYGLSGQVEYSLGPLTLTSITVWRQNRNIANDDADFASADLLGRYAADTRVRTLTQEFRAATNMEGPLNFITGAYYINERIGQTGQFAAGQGLSEAYAMQDDAVSVFGQVDFKPLHRLTLTAGVGYTHDGKRFSTDVQSSNVFSSIAPGAPKALKPLQMLPPFLNVPNAVEPGRTEDGDIAWTARASFDPAPRLKLYGNVSTGFKASSINLSRDSRPALSDAAAITAAGLAQVSQTYGMRFAGPEHARLYEAGMKADWSVAMLNLAAFKQYLKGSQTDLFNGTGFDSRNAQRETVYGFEFEGTVNPVAELTLSQSLTYLHARYDRFAAASFGDIPGTTLAGIPPLSLTAAASWDHALVNGDHLILRGDWHYASSVGIADGLPGEITTDPQTGAAVSTRAGIDAARVFVRTVSEIDASLTYRLRRGVEVSVWGRNLTDDRYITVIFDSPAQAGSGYPNQPRTYGVSALSRF